MFCEWQDLPFEYKQHSETFSKVWSLMCMQNKQKYIVLGPQSTMEEVEEVITALEKILDFILQRVWIMFRNNQREVTGKRDYLF